MAQNSEYNSPEALEFQAYLDAHPFDEPDDPNNHGPYAKGTLQKMSVKQLKRERLKQIGIADNAELGSKEEELAGSKLVYVLCELADRKVKINYN